MGERHTYRLDLAYCGSRFAGFQQQRDQITVESALLCALRAFVPELPRVAVGGKTDSGVHALGQVVSFYTRAWLPLDEMSDRIEEVGEGAIAVLRARVVPRTFHASFSARSRTYCYRAAAPDLDVERLDAMLGALVGRRCFFAFARRTPPEQTSIRHLHQARVRQDGPGRVRFELVANGFLRRQVRVLVATALRETINGAPPTALLEMSRVGDRAATAPPADADGLYLMNVSY